METVFESKSLTKRFGDTVALEEVDARVAKGSIVGLIGKNGGGKTTLLRHLSGLYLPTSGECTTLGCRSDRLGPAEMARLGIVPQEIRLLDWMTVDQHIRYVATFYDTWDRERESRLRDDLELDAGALVGSLSPGGKQKLALVLALGHRPELLILDEPVASLDPIARGILLGFLIERIEEDGATLIVSSHVLRDIERIVDQILCLDRGRVRVDSSLDDLQERYVEWLVTSRDGPLAPSFGEAYILRQEVEGRQASLIVDGHLADGETFARLHRVDLRPRPMNLERMFPLFMENDR